MCTYTYTYTYAITTTIIVASIVVFSTVTRICHRIELVISVSVLSIRIITIVVLVAICSTIVHYNLCVHILFYYNSRMPQIEALVTHRGRSLELSALYT